ncbi:dynein axonemal intermediate chain 7 isoform X2 [Parasteatoda tepidariorum]|uniref:dynein axonemal intermediate chain 7 isoform X2 n=1 Tax=Parasteatoda tepidariorum TaxID=114398 RepID=UPI0039BD0BE6
MPKKVKKGKAKKEELRRKREEEQRLREEQERKEKEERQRQREEQLKKEEEERIKAYEEKTREEQKSYINDLLQRISVLCEENQKKEWEEKRWYDYLYKTRDMDPFELPNINAYITQWNDEGNLEIQEVFHKTQQTLKLIDVIENAGYMYPCVGEKTLKLWCEGISKLKDNIFKKLDEASFILLKEANQYLNDKTENMEYNINYELDGGDKLINLCLWANLHRAFRKRGLEILHFKFHLPSEVVEEDCAIRLLFLDFNHISLEKQALRKEPNNVTSKTEDGSQFIDQKEYFLSGGILHFDLLAIPKLTVRQKGITYIYREQPVLKRIPYKQAVQLRPFLSLDKKSTIQGIQEPILEEGEEIKKFEEDEEKVPFTSQEELEQLEKDEVKVPSSSTEETDALEGVEKVQSNSGEAMQDSEAEKEIEENLGDFIYLKMKLPNKAIFWETPKPSRLCPENNRFASEGIYDVEYNPENKEVSFKTSQFGTFGFFQRRHLNLSYKASISHF